MDQNTTLSITANFGVTSLIEFIFSKEEVVSRADQALYLAKASGRNQVRHYLETQNQSDHTLINE